MPNTGSWRAVFRPHHTNRHGLIIIRTHITTALHAEARPLIDHFRLKQDTTSHHIPIFASDSIALTVGGIGKIKAAISTTFLLSQTPDIGRISALNVGIAGCSQANKEHNLQIGDSFLINKIIEFSTGRELYPDVLVDTNLAEATITTVDKPLDHDDGIDVADGLVDMEAAGFYQAATTFLPPHQVGCIKIISDFLKVERFDRNWVSDLVGQQIPAIEQIIKAYREVSDLSFDVLLPEDWEILEQIRKSLRMTVTQYNRLTDQARAYKLHTDQPLPDLTDYTQISVTDKYEGKKYLERLHDRLIST